ncbi:hypothetical protein [Nostoc sp.]|uniref:hypothetical protein n=1 Tax=Nostoc sp. TaxID=1180 RepID=UPI002FF89E00
MAYCDFSLVKVRDAFSLTLEETRNLFLTVGGVQPSDLLKRLLDENLTLVTAINSEKAVLSF